MDDLFGEIDAVLVTMTAQPVEPVGRHDPGEDPAAIFEALPPSHRAWFRAEYDEALEAAHDLARFKQVQALLRQWRLRAGPHTWGRRASMGVTLTRASRLSATIAPL
ncbi:DUF6247 family protein [Microbispora sp. NPDC046933]|uniref:DUF6247 family protein n=1 Tax=Microbispora sp. NPDC046933 TaxID=3155618 RepID=UPI0033F138FC